MASMKKLFVWIRDFVIKYDIASYMGIIASFVMAAFNIVSLAKTDDMIYAVFTIFYFGMAVLRCFLFIYKSTNVKLPAAYYFTTAFYLYISLPLLTVCLIFLLNRKPLIAFPFDFLIYGYAVYAFVKLFSSIINFRRAKKTNYPYGLASAGVSRISAYYTLLSLTVNLVGRYGGSDTAMIIIEYSLISFTSIYAFCLNIFYLKRGIQSLIRRRHKKTRHLWRA